MNIMPVWRDIFADEELGSLIAHVHGLTKSEFAHILTTFSLVAQGVKDATLAAYRNADKISKC